MDKNTDTSFYLNQIQSCFRINAPFDNIKPLLTRCVKSSPHSAVEIYNFWGMVLSFSNEFSKSAKILQKAIILDPKLTEAHINLGKPLIELGKDNEALKAFKNALKTSPSFYNIHRDLIRVLIECNRIELHQKIYKETAKELPPDVNIANLYSTAADVLINKDMIPQGCECFGKVVEIFPENVSLHLQYGKLLQQQGLFEEASREFQETLELDPSCSEAEDLRATMKKKILEDPKGSEVCFWNDRD